MKKFVYNPTSMVNVLIATSVLMFASIILAGFTSPKVMGIGMLLWIANIAWNLHLLTRGQVKQMAEYHEVQLQHSKEEKNYVIYGVQSVAFPMIIVGVSFVLISIGTLFFI